MGQTLRLGMDIRMQQEADKILGDRRGAIVAINPQDGTVLAFVSKPSFDPNLFIDGIDSETWKALNDDWKKPLVNRVTQGLYPPGSTFKPFMGMALLESGKITQTTVVPAPGAWSIPGSRHVFRDSVRSGHGSANLSKAIQVSSDTFFYRWHRPAQRIYGRFAQPRMEGETLCQIVRSYRQRMACRRDGLGQHRAGLQRLHPAANGTRHRFARQ